MKRILVIMVMAAIAIATFQACKKGENDPAISFKSRNARITAKWKLTKIEGSSVKVDGATSISTITTYDGSAYSRVETTIAGGASNSITLNSGTGTFEITIDKKGAMSFSESYTPTGAAADVQTNTGVWYWENSDKTKSYVYLSVGGVYNIFFSGRWKIDRLATKELVLISESTSDDNGITINTNNKYSFENAK